MIYRLQELEAWREEDEPVIERLAHSATVADEVRAALRGAHRRTWTRWHKLGAFTLGAITAAAGVATFLNQIGVL